MHTLVGLFPLDETHNDAFKPLSHVQFLEYFLIPHVASALIAQDLGTTLAGGYYCMEATGDVGKLQYPELDEDEELDDIYRSNLRLFKAFGKKPSIDTNQHPQAIPTEEDVENAANQLLRLKDGPGLEHVRLVMSLVINGCHLGSTQTGANRPLPRTIQRRTSPQEFKTGSSTGSPPEVITGQDASGATTV